MVQVLGEYLQLQFTQICLELNKLVKSSANSGKENIWNVYFFFLIFDCGNKTFKAKVRSEGVLPKKLSFVN